MSTALSAAETDIRDGRVFQTVAVYVVCQQAAKEQRSANEAIKAKRKDVSN
jgi:uncharacterized protein YlxP (DUF503 family)